MLQQGRNEARWRRGQEASLAPRWGFPKLMYCIEESTCDIVGTLGSRGIVPFCPPSLRSRVAAELLRILSTRKLKATNNDGNLFSEL